MALNENAENVTAISRNVDVKPSPSMTKANFSTLQTVVILRYRMHEPLWRAGTGTVDGRVPGAGPLLEREDANNHAPPRDNWCHPCEVLDVQ